MSAFLLVAILLLVGVVLRVRLSVFRWLYIPASVLAGCLGLLVIQLGQSWASDTVADWSQTLRSWPGWLIAVVFAGMLLERKPSAVGESLSRVGRQGLMVWIIVLGQTAVGMWATWLLIQPWFGVPNSFGMLIETGFAGGHGTAAAMGEVFSHPNINLESGLDLGVLMATSGLIIGVVSGILWVNVGSRAGWVRRQHTAAHSAPTDSTERGLPIGYSRVSGDTIDPLLLQIIWLGLSFGVGLALQTAMDSAASAIDAWLEPLPVDENAQAQRPSVQRIIGSFPLFIYTLFGGLIVRRALRLARFEHSIDRETINRLTASAMDVLVVAAIATLNLTAVASLLVPISILLVAGTLWAAFCLIIVSYLVLPRAHWFELGLINYGMSTGTTATGFVLLRLVDPELESGAAEDYALAAPISAPFVGGGMLTVGLPLLVLERFPISTVAVVLSLVVVALFGIASLWNSRATKPSPQSDGDFLE